MDQCCLQLRKCEVFYLIQMFMALISPLITIGGELRHLREVVERYLQSKEQGLTKMG